MNTHQQLLAHLLHIENLLSDLDDEAIRVMNMTFLARELKELVYADVGCIVSNEPGPDDIIN
jgi:hypothetical protein